MMSIIIHLEQQIILKRKIKAFGETQSEAFPLSSKTSQTSRCVYERRSAYEEHHAATALTVEEQFSINTVTGNRLEQVAVEHYYVLD